MTIKAMVSEVLDNPDRFPKGWATEVRDYFRSIGKDHLERKQRWIYELMIRTPYNGEAPTTILCRSMAKAKELMEADIRETLATRSPRFHAEDLKRDGEDNASLGDEIYWEIERKELLG